MVSKENSSLIYPSLIYSLKNSNYKNVQIEEFLYELAGRMKISQHHIHPNFSILMNLFYLILQNCNFIVKFNVHQPQTSNNTSITYSCLLKDNTHFLISDHTFEKLLNDFNQLSFLWFNFNLNQAIPNAFLYLTSFTDVLQRVSPFTPIVFLSPSTNLRKNHPRGFQGRRKRTSTLNPPPALKNYYLNHRPYRMDDTTITPSRKRENGRVNLAKSKSKSKILKSAPSCPSGKRHSSLHYNLKKLNHRFLSKYCLYQKEKEQLKSLVHQSYALMDEASMASTLSDKEKLKTFFKGKYFKDIYQKLNTLQNNLRDYVNHDTPKGFSFGHIKPNTTSSRKMVYPKSNLSETFPHTKPTTTLHDLVLKGRPLPSSTIKSSLSNLSLSPSLKSSPNLMTTTITTTNTTTTATTPSDESKTKTEVKDKENNMLSPVNHLPSTNSSSEGTSVRKNRRSKHSRSSAVCLSSSDIKGILGSQPKTSKDSTSSTSSPLERSLNDSIKYPRTFPPRPRPNSLDQETLERRKLLSRDHYQPTLSTFHSTQFCYNEHYPTVRLSYSPRTSPLYYPSASTSSPFQPLPPRRKLNV